MRKKFVQTLAARQLEYGSHIRAQDDMDCDKQTEHQQQQPDGSSEEIIEILDDDQEVELMMERHRKYHPRKYVNLQHPPSKIYYDKIDKIVSPLGDKEDQEDEDERNQLVIEESHPRELNNNSVSSSSLASSVSGGHDDRTLSPGSAIPRNEEEALLLQEYHYRQLYGYGSHLALHTVAPGGRPSSRDLQQPHQKRLKRASQRPSSDLPGSLMGPPTYPHPTHPAVYERTNPYGHRSVPYDRNPVHSHVPYYRRKEERRMSVHSAPRASQVETNGVFVVPGSRKEERSKRETKSNSAFSPPRDTPQSTSHNSHHTSAGPPSLAAPPVTETSAIVTPHTPPYYQQPQAYHRSSSTGRSKSTETNSYLALEDWYRSGGVPPPHMLTTADLQSLYYYHYYFNKMAASSVYHHPYRDHTLPSTATTVGLTQSAIGAMSTVPPMAGTAMVESTYPPPQYGFAKGPSDQPSLYGTQQPYDYAPYHTVLAKSGFIPTPSGQSQSAIASTVPASSVSSSPPAEIIRPSVINHTQISTTVPQNVPRTVPINLVHRPTPSQGVTVATEQTNAYPSNGATSRGEQEPPQPRILPARPLPTRPRAAIVEQQEGSKRHAGDSDRASGATTTQVAVSTAATVANNASQIVPSVGSSSVPPKPKAPPKVEESSAKKTAEANPPVAPSAVSRSEASPPPAPASAPVPPPPTQSRPRGRPPGTKNKESAKAVAARASVPGPEPKVIVPPAPVVVRDVPELSPAAISARVECMKQEIDIFLNRRRTEVITTMRLYSTGRLEYAGLLHEMKRHTIVYRDFLMVAYELMKRARLHGFVRDPPIELDYCWKSPPQEFADYFAQNEQCSMGFVKENFDFLALIVDNLLKQYIDPLKYFLLTYVLGLRPK
ncbi:hypothetical protein ZHAS_00002812 [Anopheles sinensis]|uniref:Uncharacterized protein n=1 Tax=Anopheles sinensis TaxID=74873 RepID=A0A084VD21_ANOSI|nr:hypothetical protein ZHAS_00002812 [Anopheles sinensis]